MKRLSELGEKKLIFEIQKLLFKKKSSVLCGIGDDAAVLKVANKKLLVTTDSLQENIHFKWSYTSAYLLGRKSLSVNLSDIAAMGGKPLWAVVSIAVPSQEKALRVLEFYKGLKDCADDFDVMIVGGDTDRSSGGWKISLTLIGEVENPIYRNGANRGDEIWVTGWPGKSALGLEILQNKKVQNKNLKYFNEVKSAHLSPVPRIKIGEILSKQKIATSMIDISDGLLLDLEHLCKASHVGAKINLESIPIEKHFLEIAQQYEKNPYQFILSGGEDYELLFTASSHQKNKILQISKKIKTPIHCIGNIVSSAQGIKVIQTSGKKIFLKKKGFSHF